jgi:hypothetical protein
LFQAGVPPPIHVMLIRQTKNEDQGDDSGANSRIAVHGNSLFGSLLSLCDGR